MLQKRTFFKYKEEDLLKAMDEISKGAKIRETCRNYNIPHSTVINKIKLKYPVQRKMGPPTILNKQEEFLLKTRIMAMTKKGFPVNKKMCAFNTYQQENLIYCYTMVIHSGKMLATGLLLNGTAPRNGEAAKHL